MDMRRTKIALARYDKLEPIFSDLMVKVGNEAALALAEVIEILAENVGAAYGEDTRNLNNPDTCRDTIRPGPRVPPEGEELSFVRRMIARGE